MKLLSTIVPYLLIVSFFSEGLSDFDYKKITSINQSIYNGVAVAVIEAYDTGQYSLEDFGLSIKTIKQSSKKDVWPWVFFNRFIGSETKAKSHSVLSTSTYFKNIKGMDIYNEAGALGDFYHIWKISLSIAKELDSPGIVVDPETYNNYRSIDLLYLTRRLSVQREELIRRLEEIGAELVNITDKVYPEAVLWFLFTGLSSPERIGVVWKDKDYVSVAYIVKGMLERANQINSSIKIVAGGESSIGYCSYSYADLNNTIQKRYRQYKKELISYPNLQLGGTIAPWDNTDSKDGWMLRGKCKGSSAKNIFDFDPLIRLLLKHYDYLWIYAAGAAGYNPYRNDFVSKKLNFRYEIN